jgi:hypothetical protein
VPTLSHFFSELLASTLISPPRADPDIPIFTAAKSEYAKLQ